MDLNHLHLHVADIPRAMAFYERHFAFAPLWDDPDEGIQFIRNAEGFDLALMADEHPGSMPDWWHFGFRLTTNGAVRQKYEELGEAGVEICEPLTEDDGLISFRVLDPDGYKIEVYWE
ncbi:hypothetical protein AYO38_03295 [bacterium SCGC AG-212-C10]|nr:hypothetical protein AYO38_03295 [bacterium SCGC AG-212-C10]